jgi:hypothetical protein
VGFKELKYNKMQESTTRLNISCEPEVKISPLDKLRGVSNVPEVFVSDGPACVSCQFWVHEECMGLTRH